REPSSSTLRTFSRVIARACLICSVLGRTADPRREVEMARSHQVLLRVATPLAVIVCVGAPALAQRSDRATISGVVTDAQGSAVPGATGTIHHDDTKVKTL